MHIFKCSPEREGGREGRQEGGRACLGEPPRPQAGASSFCCPQGCRAGRAGTVRRKELFLLSALRLQPSVWQQRWGLGFGSEHAGPGPSCLKDVAAVLPGTWREPRVKPTAALTGPPSGRHGEPRRGHRRTCGEWGPRGYTRAMRARRGRWLQALFPQAWSTEYLIVFLNEDCF